MTSETTTTGMLRDAIRAPYVKPEEPKMRAQARQNLRTAVAALKVEIAASAVYMAQPQKRRITELAKTLEAHIQML
ncbi:hypothetical protein SAMN05428982_2762 [Pseudoxanthomonas sp. CF385]|uniref:hypothetical protein n=1 Tax=Pseudoxanthomonas sp. CF385 TaxID=1881042 RepID=UPI00088E4FD3|nr:hypothetical protein [Pseudoxanthomonas sp. CF385]SDQ98775.1 hypothetical protein SAMN05428982_2762 [Pseudoxanthomonas sp. CF385]